MANAQPKIGTMPPQAREIILAVAAERGIDPLKIVNPGRRKKVFRARVEVAKLLDARGYSTNRIGAILNHDHTTIVFYLGRGKKKPSRPIWRAPKVRHVRFIKPPSKPRPIKSYLKPYAGADMTEYRWTPRQQEQRP